MSLQEQSSRQEICVLQEQLQSKEELLAEFQKSLLHKEREVEEPKTEDGKYVPNRQVLFHADIIFIISYVAMIPPQCLYTSLEGRGEERVRANSLGTPKHFRIL